MTFYLLTCPECQHQARVRFIRKGATATCAACHHQFRVDAKSMAADPRADPQPPAADPGDRPFELLRDRIAHSDDAEPSPVAALAQSAAAVVADDPPTHAIAAATKPDVAAVAAVAAAIKPRDPAAARARLADRRARRKSPAPLIAAAALVGLILVGVLVGLIASSGSNPEGPNPPLTTNPPDKPVTPPDTPHTPDTPTPAAIPVLTLQVPPVTETRWTPIDPPTAPFAPSSLAPSAVWQAGFVRDPRTESLKVLGLYVADSDAVYRAANVRVQLLDANRMAYAEMTGVVPVICAAQGVQMSVAVPAELAARAGGLVSRFDPVDPLPGAVPLEMVESEAKLLSPTADGWRVELAVRNPHDSPVDDPTIIVDLHDTAGSIIQTWRGSLRARVGSGDLFRFQTVLPVPSDAEPGRVSVRGYAVRSR